MSLADVALVDAVVAMLRVEIAQLDETNCQPQPDGMPPATAAKFFVGVDESGVIVPRAESENFLEEINAVEVVVSVRTGFLPKDRKVSAYQWNKSGAADLERAIINVIHGSEQLRDLADQMLDDGYPFNGPLWYRGRGKTTPRGSEWSSGPSSEQSPDTWITRTLRFEGAPRIMPRDQIT